MPVTIDYDKCSSCGTCYDICPLDVFAWDKDKNVPTVAYSAECWHCGSCYYDCPENAIDVTLPFEIA